MLCTVCFGFVVVVVDVVFGSSSFRVVVAVSSFGRRPRASLSLSSCFVLVSLSLLGRSRGSLSSSSSSPRGCRRRCRFCFVIDHI